MKILVFGASSASAKAFIKLVISQLSQVEVARVFRDQITDTNDFPNATKIKNVLIREKPSHIVNFIGAFTNNFETDMRANFTVSQKILESVVVSALQVKILMIGSASEYGLVESSHLPIKESTPLNPSSVYGLTKSLQTHLVEYFARHQKINVCIARPFNLLGPHFSSSLFVGKVYSQIVEIKKQVRKQIEVGDLKQERDYLDVHLAVEEFLRILLFGKSGEVYNVCSGKPAKMKTVLEAILEKENCSGVLVKEDPTLFKSLITTSYGDRTKLDTLPITKEYFC